MDFRDILLAAKNGDKDCKEMIIDKYYPLIIKHSKDVFLKNMTFEDILQIGVINLLNAVDKFDINKPICSFPSYALWSIKNGYRYLCRKEIRYNEESSLNIPTVEGYEVGDFLYGNEDVEKSVISNFEVTAVREALQILDEEERDLIIFMFFGEKKRTLTKYSTYTGKDYYYCTVLKNRTFNKLKKFLKKKIM